MPVPRSGTSVFSFGAGVEKIRRCNAELMRWMVLWEVSTGLSMWTAAPAMGHRGLGDCRGQAFPLASTIQGDRLQWRLSKECPQRDEAFCRRGTGKFLPNTLERAVTFVGAT